MIEIGHVFMNSNHESCIKICAREGVVDFVALKSGALIVKQLPCSEFDSEWNPYDFPLQTMLTKYFSLSKVAGTSPLVTLMLEAIRDGRDVVPFLVATETPLATESPVVQQQAPIDVCLLNEGTAITPSAQDAKLPSNASISDLAAWISGDARPSQTNPEHSGQGYQVHVTDNSVLVEMGKQAEKKMAPVSFAEKPLTVVLSPNAQPMFWMATNDDGLVVRLVSKTIEDRAVTAAMVGNWVAEGLNVTQINLKDLRKQLGNLEKALKPSVEPVVATSEPTLPASPDLGATPSPSDSSNDAVIPESQSAQVA